MSKLNLTPEQEAHIKALQEILDLRHSCRAYRAEPVPQAIIENILAMAQRTASWCNTQPWQVVITHGQATERFRQALAIEMEKPDEATDFVMPLRYEGVYLQRRRESGFALYNAVGVPRGDREAAARQAHENFRLFGAPHVAIVTSASDLGDYGAIDCGAWVNNFMLAATAHGVASIAQAALARRPTFLRNYFNWPADRKIVCGISFGYSNEKHPANSFRTSREEIASHVRFV